MDQNLLIK